MAKYVICAVRDRAVDAFGMPIFVRHAGEAMRSFSDEINKVGSTFNQHPDDYDLYKVGEYDDEFGTILPNDRPDMLATGKSVVVPAV